MTLLETVLTVAVILLAVVVAAGFVVAIRVFARGVCVCVFQLGRGRSDTGAVAQRPGRSAIGGQAHRGGKKTGRSRQPGPRAEANPRGRGPRTAAAGARRPTPPPRRPRPPRPAWTRGASLTTPGPRRMAFSTAAARAGRQRCGSRPGLAARRAGEREVATLTSVAKEQTADAERRQQRLDDRERLLAEDAERLADRDRRIAAAEAELGEREAGPVPRVRDRRARRRSSNANWSGSPA